VGTTSVSSLLPSLIKPDHTSMTINYNASAKITSKLSSGGSPLTGKSVRISGGSTVATQVSDGSGAFSFTVKPIVATTYTLSFAGDATHPATVATVKVTPHAYVSKPVLSTSHVTHSHSFNTRADVHPKHTKGTHAVLTFTFQRSEKGHWVTHKTVSATAVSVGRWTRGTVSAKLTTGKWRVQAVHSDAGHASSSSARTYFTIH
jgi:hypothetical protein